MIGVQALGLENPMLSILVPAKIKSHNLRPTVESLFPESTHNLTA